MEWSSILLVASASLSIVGSSVIIYRFIHCKSWNKPYERLVAGLSLSDLFLSIGIVITPFALRTKNSRVCSYDGLIKHVGVAGPLYNSALSFYYWIMIVHGTKEKRMAKFYEPFMHVIVWAFAAASGISGLLLRAYNPSLETDLCWIVAVPEDCNGTDIPCVGATHLVTKWLTIVTVYVPLLLVFVSLIVNNLWIYFHVKKAERNARRYEFRESTDFRESRLSIVSSALRPSKSTSSSKAQQVASQSFCFVLAFCISYTVSAVLELIGWLDPVGINTDRYIVLKYFRAALYPLQGLLNMFVYTRPRYLRWRKWSPDSSRLQCLYYALVTFSVPTRLVSPKETKREIAAVDNDSTTENPTLGSIPNPELYHPS